MDLLYFQNPHLLDEVSIEWFCFHYSYCFSETFKMNCLKMDALLKSKVWKYLKNYQIIKVTHNTLSTRITKLVRDCNT